MNTKDLTWQKNEPIISVWIITYNHVDFISDCIDSILAQKTSYSFEICIGEDDSSDGTREICQAYANKYPEIIRLFLRDRQDYRRQQCQGNWQFNFIETFKECRGKYIATCDGDDYWTDETKLQMQVEFLENNLDYSGCFHKIGIVDTDRNIIVKDTGYPPIKQERYDLDFALKYSNFSPMFSVVFRNRPDVAPEWIKEAPFGDFIIHIQNLQFGDYGFIDRVMGHYRIHQDGLASGSKRSENVKDTIDVYKLIAEHYDLKARKSYKQGIWALKLSYITERFLELILPNKIKRLYDFKYGKHVRAKVRKLVTMSQ